MFFVDKPQTFDDNKTKNDNLNYRFLLWIYFWIYFQNAYVIVGFDGLLVVISFI